VLGFVVRDEVGNAPQPAIVLCLQTKFVETLTGGSADFGGNTAGTAPL
jgi:hypothetical protein